MPLTLKIISPTNLPTGQLPEFTFDELGGSIGRKPNNDFVLIDPERFISSQHACIIFQNGKFLITDTSTNGVFINNAKRPVGNGNSQEIANGDKISIGEFQLQFALANTTAANTDWGSPDISPAPSIAPPIATPPMTPSAIDSFEFSEPLIPDSSSSDDLNSVDPLALLDGTTGSTSDVSDNFMDSLLSPQMPQTMEPITDVSDVLSNPHQNIPEPLPINEPFTPPSAIPDDWDIMGDANKTAETITPANEEPLGVDSLFPNTQQENTSPLIPEGDSIFDDDDIFASLGGSTADTPASILPASQQVVKPPPPKQAPTQAAATPPTQAQPVSQPANTAVQNNDLLNAFIKGAGLDLRQVNTNNPEELMTKLGQLTRISTEGLMMALRARATIKSSFRVSKTIIAPIENNPLKFSVTSEDALNIVFAGDKAGYMAATEAFTEGFKDLQSHQMAMMAGMQGTIKAITEQFSPDILERKFNANQSNSSFSLPGNKKAKNWEMYELFYKKITSTLLDDFQNVYGEEFARAYENQIQKLL